MKKKRKITLEQGVPKLESEKKYNIILLSFPPAIMNPKVVLKESNKNFFSLRKKEKESIEFGFNSTYTVLIALIGCLLIYYVWILNVNATQGYNIRQLEIEKNNLLLQKDLLDVKIAELESLGNILKEEDTKGMEKIEDPDYLVIKEGVQYVYNN